MAIYGNMAAQNTKLASADIQKIGKDQRGEGEMVMDQLHTDFQQKLYRREDELRKHFQEEDKEDK